MRQPWAWAIVHGGKDVENRTRNVAGSYRGPVAIHAGLTVDESAKDSALIDDAWHARYGWQPAHNGLFETGSFVGVVDLVDVHVAEPAPTCCPSPWAVMGWLDSSDPVHHLVLENPRSFGFLGESPIRAKGRLGLWTPPADVLEQLQAVAR